MIIAISGKKQTGKNTVANLIAEQYKDKEEFVVVQNSFASKLKKIVQILLDCDLEDLEKEEFKESMVDERFWWKDDDGNIIKKMTVRNVMQHVGTKLFRHRYNPKIWINGVIDDYKKKEKQCNEEGKKLIYLVTDLRFVNELGEIKYEIEDYYTVRVSRDVEKDYGCQSETDLDSYEAWNFHINNDSGLEYLKEQVEWMLELIEDKRYLKNNRSLDCKKFHLPYENYDENKEFYIYRDGSIIEELYKLGYYYNQNPYKGFGKERPFIYIHRDGSITDGNNEEEFAKNDYEEIDIQSITRVSLK